MPTMLVTGANRGLGLAFARSYAADGWRVHATARDPDAAPELRALAGDVAVHRLEVTDEAAYSALAAALAGEALDLVVANAGVMGPGDSLDALDGPGWLRTYEVNALGPVRLAAALRHHVARSRRRTLVAISSGLGSITDNTSGGSLAYRCSKAALGMAWRSLAVELRGQSIVCTVVHPGWARTRMGGAGAPLTPERSVAAMRAVIDRLTLADSGRFYAYTGAEVPW